MANQTSSLIYVATCKLLEEIVPEKVFRIVWWPLDGWVLLVTGGTEEPTHILNVGVGHRGVTGSMSVVSDNHSLSNWSFHLLVQNEQHCSVEIHRLGLAEE